jgi:predicted NBD/HSP70 family sugar kinase
MVVMKLHFKSTDKKVEFNVTGPLDVVKGDAATVNMILWQMRIALRDHFVNRLGCELEFDVDHDA